MADPTGPIDIFARDYVFSAARQGTLTQRQILDYQKASGDLNALDTHGLSLLCSAAMNGHQTIVRRLIRNGASVNAPSLHNCFPLWFATRVLDQAKAGQIVKMLLEAGAMVNVISDKSMMATTPLMNLMRAGHGLTLISWLLVKGAKVNWPGTYTEGEDGGMDSTLQGPLITRSADKDAKFLGNKGYIDTLKSHEPPAPKGFLGSAMDAFLGYLAAVVSKITTKAVTTSNGDDKNSGTIDHAAFNDDLLQKIADAGLSKYFPPDSPFLQTVVSKAIELAERGDCVLGSPEYLPGLSRLSLYQPILYCDNSGSMNTRERIDSMIEIVGKITSICTLLLPDDEGVQIRFLNGGSKEKALYEKYGTVRRASDAEKMINDADYSGVTKLGTILRSDVLCPFVYDVLDGKNGGNGEGGLKRPLLISIITDGCPYKEEPDQLAKTIAECKSILRQRDIDPDAVKFQVTQIGDDKSAEDFLGQLANDPAVKDDIYITRGKIDEEFKKREGDEDEMDVWLLKTLTGPILVEEN